MKNKDGLFSNFIKLFLAQSDSNKENARAHSEETQVIFEDELLDSTSNLNGSVEFHINNRSMTQSKRSSASVTPTLIQKQDSVNSHYDSDLNLILKSRNNTVNAPNNNIIDKENIESGTIKMSVLIDYIKKCGIINSVLFIVFFIMSTVSLAASSLWLSAWSNRAEKDQLEFGAQSQESKYFYLCIYVVLGLAQCILLNVSNIFLVLMYIRAAKLFHIKLLSSILRSTLHFSNHRPQVELLIVSFFFN